VGAERFGGEGGPGVLLKAEKTVWLPGIFYKMISGDF
jgi:hypothetical protein